MENHNNLPADCQSESGELGTIYKITCLTSKKSYVGKTKQDLDIRINKHKSNSKRAKNGIDAAIRKYGWDGNFIVEVLETCPVEKLNEREIFQIREQNTKAPHGYNLTDGGDGGRGKSPSAETRAKLSAALKGRPAHNKGVPHTAAARANMSAAQKAIGNRPPNHKGEKRDPRSPETKAKLSAANTGKHHSAETCAKISAALKAYWARKKLESQNHS